MSFLKAQVSFSSNVASIFSATKNNSSILFLAETLFTLVKSSLLKCKFVRLLSTRVKICQIPYVNSSSIFASFFIIMAHNSPINFKLIHFQFQTKGYHQGHNLETFKYFGENLPNFSCQFLEAQASFPSNFVSVLSAIKHNSSLFFQMKH